MDLADIEQIRQEAQLWLQASGHPNIVDGYGPFLVSSGPYMIEVNAPGFDMTAETVQLTRPEQRDFTLQTGTFSSIITVNEPGGFFAGSSTSATKTDAPLIEIPQSVSVVTEDQLTSRNVQTVADDSANLPGQVVCAIRSSKIRRYRLSPAAAVANLGDDGVGFGLAAAIVNQTLCASLSECQGASAAYAAGSSSDKSGFA